jgi:hypothetical protein
MKNAFIIVIVSDCLDGGDEEILDSDFILSRANDSGERKESHHRSI